MGAERARGGWKGLYQALLVPPVLLREIPVKERAPILKAWCQVATSGRQHLPISPEAPVDDFEAIADDYPVFRIDDEKI